MKKILCLIILLELVSACKPENTKVKETSTVAIEDSLLLDFVSTKFNVKKKYLKQELEFFYDLEGNHYKEITIIPGNYKLRTFNLGDVQRYCPFAVKISTANDSLIDFFTFTDELFYLYNPVQARWNEFDNKIVFPESENKYSPSDTLKNLETNLNLLIRKLNYQKDEKAIKILLEVVFRDLLKMRHVEYDKVEYLKNNLVKLNKKYPLESAIQEYSELLNDKDKFSAEAREGVYGYWVFPIESDKDEFIVKPKFIGDLLYYNIYW